MRVGDRSGEKTFGRETFDLSLYVDLRKGERADIEVSCDKWFGPGEEGSEDSRRLALLLQRPRCLILCVNGVFIIRRQSVR